MIFISGYESDLYNSILLEKRGWSKKEIETVTKDSTGQSHDRTEIVWMNKYFLKAVESDTVPIKLTEKEKKEGKVNPERL